ncbi:MAG: sialidase family protein [Planctomycetota bacterium]
MTTVRLERAQRVERHLVLALALLASIATARAEDAAPVFPAGWKEPQVAVSSQHGVFVVAAKDGVIAVASSSDGKTFGEPVRVAAVDKLMCGMRRGPRIAASGKSVVVTAISAETGDLAAWRSTDGGVTWAPPVRVNGADKSAREGLDGLAASAKDDFAVVWLDDRKGKGKEVWVATSRDGGATWTERFVYASPDGTVCECCHPSAAWNAKGELAVMFRNALDGSRDLYMTVSKDLGKTWTGAQKLGDGSWKAKMCPMDGGALAGGATEFVSVWRREGDVFAVLPGRTEQRLASGKQPWVAQTKDAIHAVWVEGGDLVASSGKKKTRIAQGATDPCIAGSIAGDGPVVVVWQSDDGVHAKTLVGKK